MWICISMYIGVRARVWWPASAPPLLADLELFHAIVCSAPPAPLLPVLLPLPVLAIKQGPIQIEIFNMFKCKKKSEDSVMLFIVFVKYHVLPLRNRCVRKTCLTSTHCHLTLGERGVFWLKQKPATENAHARFKCTHTQRNLLALILWGKFLPQRGVCIRYFLLEISNLVVHHHRFLSSFCKLFF